MNASNTASRLLDMVAKATQAKAAGVESANTARAGETISEEAASALKDMALVDDETRGLLDALEGARGDLKTNPFARREWLRSLIADLAKNPNPDPERVLAIMFASMARKLPNGERAMPVITARPRDEAARWGKDVIILPRGEREKGRITARGLMWIVPTTAEDAPYLRMLKGIRASAAASLVEMVEGESLPDFRRIVWLALYFMPRASIWTTESLERSFENGDGEQLRRKSQTGSGKAQTFDYFVFSDEDVLVMEHTELTERFAVQLRNLSAYAEKFWGGGVDVLAEVESTVRQEELRCITPRDFLQNLPGLCAVKHNAWKRHRDKDETVEVVVLFERRLVDGHWRWVYANPEAAKALFGGRRLSYHSWTKDEVPGYIQYLLRNAQHITPDSLEPQGYPDELPEVPVEAEAPVEGTEAEAPQEPEDGKKRRSKAGSKRRRK